MTKVSTYIKKGKIEASSKLKKEVRNKTSKFIYKGTKVNISNSSNNKSTEASLVVPIENTDFNVTHKSKKMQISIRRMCLMEIMAGNFEAAESGLTKSEQFIYTKYSKMKPKEQQQELTNLDELYLKF